MAIDILPKEFPSTPDHAILIGDAHEHPAYADASADIVLCSCDQVLFRVHSITLTLASGWFRTLLSLPQGPPPYKQALTPEILHVAEPADVIAGLLCMSSGQELPKLDSFEYVVELLHAAEKYDMPGALSIIRLAVTSPPLLDSHPIRIYGIACQWGWFEEARLASLKTLGLDLFSPGTAKDLSSIDSPYLTKLMALHRQRRDVLQSGLDSPSEFYANGYPGRCVNCQREVIHSAWFQMKYAWLAAIEKRPDEIATGGIMLRRELQELLEAACQHCHRKLYNAEGTIGKLRAVLDRLPTVVEVSRCGHKHYAPITDASYIKLD
ncbi:hypothetical protein EW026_g43 [Hermanssonia centrifuga]|uniref:BTB domain-containing protein n=1 Tax=Hermanssonia centrifuga TaxID=98765 RepID=A0A4S4KVR0_9APHY|nr:hypothetical protein EW026_g43 [Hermanssonia centrifuga]